VVLSSKNVIANEFNLEAEKLKKQFEILQSKSILDKFDKNLLNTSKNKSVDYRTPNMNPEKLKLINLKNPDLRIK